MIEVITSESWHRLVPEESKFGPKFKFSNQKLVFCPMAFIGDFFAGLNTFRPEWDFILITGGSDHNLYEYETHYAITHNFTLQGGFYNIPKQVKKWFVSGACVKHPKIQFIPLGMCDDILGKTNILKYEYVTNFKENVCYVNWTNHTEERYKLKDELRKSGNDKFYIKEFIPYTEFQEDLSKSRYTVCTAGIGLDCYRNYEALMCGSYPILLRNQWAEQFAETMGGTVLLDNWKELYNNGWEVKPINREKLSMEYWRNLINKEVENVL